MCYVKPVKYLCHNLQNDLVKLFEITQTMCPEKTNAIRLRWVFQIPVRYKSKIGKKIISIFSRIERERES